jgi:hypothetical protein
LNSECIFIWISASIKETFGLLFDNIFVVLGQLLPLQLQLVPLIFEPKVHDIRYESKQHQKRDVFIPLEFDYLVG